MSLHLELFKHITELQYVNCTIKQKLLKYQKQTTSVAVKCHYPSWELFLTDMAPTKNNNAHNAASFWKQGNKGENNSIFSRCESPIECQSRIKHVKGGDESSVIMSSSQSEKQQRNEESKNMNVSNNVHLQQHKDPFLVYNMPEIPLEKALEQHSVHQILKFIQKYEKIKSITPDTFRNAYQQDKQVSKQQNQMLIQSLSMSSRKTPLKQAQPTEMMSNNGHNNTKKKSNRVLQMDENFSVKKNKIYDQKSINILKSSSNPPVKLRKDVVKGTALREIKVKDENMLDETKNKYKQRTVLSSQRQDYECEMLAMQNTKLRRKIKDLQHILNQSTLDY